MHKHTFIQLLKTFTPEEMSAFRAFVSSEYFNTKPSVIKLVSELEKFYPEFSDEAITKSNLHSKLFPGKKYNDSNLRVLFHNASDLGRKFVGYRNFENDRFEFEFRQLLTLLDRHILGYAEKLVPKLMNDVKEDKSVSDVHYYNKYRIASENLFYLSEKNYGIFEKVLGEMELEKVFKHLTSYYLLKSVRLYVNQLNLKIIYNKMPDTGIFEKILLPMEKYISTEVPVVRIYYKIVQLFLDEGNEKNFLDIKDLLNDISGDLNTEDLAEIYVNLTNYCNRRINAGEGKFLREKFELYKEENRLKLYGLKGYMPTTYFRNLVTIGLSLNEYEWVREFMEDYKDELPDTSGGNIYLYSLALYEFEMKNFGRSLEHLAKIKPDEIRLKYDIRILQIMNHYEMNSEETLLSSLEAFRHFNASNMLLTASKKSIYGNFHKTFSKIIKHRSAGNRFELQRISENLNKNVPVPYKAWVEKKVGEILSRLTG